MNVINDLQWGITTGNKTKEFAVFYNLAYLRILQIIQFSEHGKHIHWSKLDAKYENKIKSSYSDLAEANKHFKNPTYFKLANYIWKAFQHEKNSSGFSINDRDKLRIHEVLKKLHEIRNFHSHIWHTNRNLIFSEPLKDWILKLHYQALAAMAEAFPGDVGEYQKNHLDFPLFNKHESKHYITKEGRIFFLCLFLTSGEMNRFLDQCRGSKRQDELKYRIKRKVYRYYTHRDGASFKHYQVRERESILDSLSIEERALYDNDRMGYKILNYLNQIPESANSPEIYPCIPIKGQWEVPKTPADYVLSMNEGFHLKSLSLHTNSDYPNHIIVKLEGEVFAVKVSQQTIHRILIDNYKHEPYGVNFLQQIVRVIDERKTIVHIIEQYTGEVSETDTNLLLAYLNRLLSEDRYAYEDYSVWLDKVLTRRDITEKFTKKLIDRLTNIPINFRYRDLFYGLTLDDLKDEAEKNNIQVMKRIATRINENASLGQNVTLRTKTEEDPKHLSHFELLAGNSKYDIGKSDLPKVEQYISKIPLLEKLMPSIWHSIHNTPSKSELSFKDFFVELTEIPRTADRFVYYAVKYLIDHQVCPDWKFQFERTEPDHKKLKEGLSIFRKGRHFYSVWPSDDMHQDQEEETLTTPFQLSIHDQNILVKVGGIEVPLIIGHRCLKNLMIVHFYSQTNQTKAEKLLGHFFTRLKSDINNVIHGNSKSLTFLEPKMIPRYLHSGTSTPTLEAVLGRTEKRLQYIGKKLNDTRKSDMRLSRNSKNRMIMDCYRFWDWKPKFLRKEEYQILSKYHYFLENKFKGSYKAQKSAKNILNKMLDEIESINDPSYDKHSRNGLSRFPAEIWKILSTSKSLNDIFETVLDKTLEKLDAWSKTLNHSDELNLKRIAQKVGITYDIPPLAALNERSFIPFAIHPELPVKVFKKEMKGADNFSKIIWNDENRWRSDLHPFHYGYKPLLTPFLESDSKSHHKIKSRIIGVNNTQITKDYILYRIALAYKLKGHDFRDPLFDRYIQVGKHRNSTRVFQLSDKNEYPIKLSLSYHQLDDYAFTGDFQLLKDLADYSIRARHINVNPLTYQKLKTTWDRIYQQSLSAAEAILNWEMGILIKNRDYKTDLEWNKDYHSFNQVIQSIEKIRTSAPNDPTTAKMATVLHDNERMDQLKDFRYHCFHAQIPKDWTYEERLRLEPENWFNDLLGFKKVE